MSTSCLRRSVQALSLRHGLAAAVALVLLLPYFLLLSRVPNWHGLPFAEWAPVLLFTTAQAVVSALVSVVLGFWAALGLLQARSQKWQLIYLLPNTVPTLFVLIGVLNLLRPFPFGFAGIVLVHSLLNLGVVAVMMREVLLVKVGGMAELAWVEGASRFQFLRTISGYLKRDLFWAFALVLALCFTSFTVPLVIGGYHGTTVEVLIYEKVVQEGAWSEAIVLSALQMGFIVLLTLFMRGQAAHTVVAREALPYLFQKWARILPVAASVAVLLGCLGGIGRGLEQLQRIPNLGIVLREAFQGTVLVSSGTSLLSLLFLFILAYVLPHRLLDSWLMGYVAPSAVILGFGFLTLASGNSTPSAMAVSGALMLLYLPSLLRLGWMGTFAGLRRQIIVAKTLGASRNLIYRRVVWPQIWSLSCFLAGLAGLWASGDIAISGILLGGQSTLALLIESLVASYRLELATVMVWLLVACGSLVFWIFWSFGYVANHRSQS